MNRNRKATKWVAAALAVCLALGPAWSASASSNAWYDTYLTAESNLGDDYYASDDSGLLAWGESYILDSYLDLYGLTKDASWLDKFVTHADTVVATADDIDNDGYLGWSSPRYTPVEDDNWDFEDASSTDSTLPAHWTRFQSTSSTALRTTDHPPQTAGSYAVEIRTESTGTKWQSLYQQLNTYEPDTLYVLQFYGKTNGSAAKGRAYLRDKTTNTILCTVPFENTAWEYKTTECRTPAATGHVLEVWLGHQTYTVPNGKAFFDNVKVSAKLPFMVHDGVIGTSIAKFVRLIHQNASLQPAYSAKANGYRTFLESHIVPRWENSSYIGNTWAPLSSTTGMYKQSANFDAFSHTATWTYLPYNQALAYANLLIVLYEVNGNATYLDRAKRVGQYFKNALTANGTAYNWNYAYYAATVEDTSHANVDLGFVLDMYRNGQIFTGADMDKFTNTLTDVMWNGSTTAPTLTHYVNGTGATDFSKYMSNWTELGQFAMGVFPIAAGQYNGFTPTNTAYLLTLARIMKWDRSKIVNQGFELTTSTDTTQPAQWNRIGSTASTAYLDAANAYEGKYGLTIKANGSTAQQVNQTWTHWLPSTSYTMTFMGKTDGTGAGGKVYVKNETTGAIIASLSFHDTAWTAKTVTFTSPASPTDVVRTYVTNDNATVTNGKAHIDNIKLRVSTDAW
ncbi:hypothetical protein [Paenibacillus flagellatus]|uniref:CBM-cenC domain-containing protein n=1 Tax=Paenibacillus flagellatus TaxID=2211139 RepID=A0A2V5K5D1_9BACL|nr:hypothetical protein [Paenibacillus flagellatus]PYI54551.1 hypothetical protein DLM86_13900 [Paenibacillus flagellatus]